MSTAQVTFANYTGLALSIKVGDAAPKLLSCQGSFTHAIPATGYSTTSNQVVVQADGYSADKTGYTIAPVTIAANTFAPGSSTNLFIGVQNPKQERNAGVQPFNKKDKSILFLACPKGRVTRSNRVQSFNPVADTTKVNKQISLNSTLTGAMVKANRKPIIDDLKDWYKDYTSGSSWWMWLIIFVIVIVVILVVIFVIMAIVKKRKSKQ